MGVAAVLIREARDAAGLTLAELAERAGTSKPTLSKYENGLVDPRAETLDRVLRACGRSLRATDGQLPGTSKEVQSRFAARSGPTADDVTRTDDGHELRSLADLQAFASELRDEGVLGDDGDGELNEADT